MDCSEYGQRIAMSMPRVAAEDKLICRSAAGVVMSWKNCQVCWRAVGPKRSVGLEVVR